MEKDFFVSVRDEGADCRLILTLRPASARHALNQRACETVRSGVDTAVLRRWHQFYVAYSVGRGRRPLITPADFAIECPLLALSGHCCARMSAFGSKTDIALQVSLFFVAQFLGEC